MQSQIFISYSHKDRKWLDRLNTFLRPLIRAQTLSVWDDTKIKSGDVWREEIKAALSAAQVAVLMVSPEFLASDFIAEHELPPLLDAASDKGLKILWIALRHSLYAETALARYQAANDPSKPLAGLRGDALDRELLKICMKIKSLVRPETAPRLSIDKAPLKPSLDRNAETSSSVAEMRGAQQLLPRIEDLATLRTMAKRHNLNEHVADTHTVRMSHYPTAFVIDYIGTTEDKDVSLIGGQEAILNFKGEINALGFYYQQGMQYGSITVKLRDGSVHGYLGKEFFPNVSFFGLYSSVAIDVLHIKTEPKGGGFYIRSFYFYSLQNHPRIFADIQR